jgi:hypothetical protein
MSRLVTANEYMDQFIVSTLQKWADERGDNVQIVASRPKPKLATNGGVVILKAAKAEDEQ